MTSLEIEMHEIPHGHGLSFKKGIADGLLECRDHENTCHETHAASYRRGCEVGVKLKEQVARLKKD